jgi:hypothetical protein
MNAMNLKKEHTIPGFRTGGHMTTKDRPRKKDWKREYERGKGSGASYKDFTGPFSLRFAVHHSDPLTDTDDLSGCSGK